MNQRIRRLCLVPGHIRRQVHAVQFQRRVHARQKGVHRSRVGGLQHHQGHFGAVTGDQGHSPRVAQHVGFQDVRTRSTQFNAGPGPRHRSQCRVQRRVRLTSPFPHIHDQRRTGRGGSRDRCRDPLG